MAGVRACTTGSSPAATSWDTSTTRGGGTSPVFCAAEPPRPCSSSWRASVWMDAIVSFEQGRRSDGSNRALLPSSVDDASPRPEPNAPSSLLLSLAIRMTCAPWPSTSCCDALGQDWGESTPRGGAAHSYQGSRFLRTLAMAFPMPLEPPVMITTLPFSRKRGGTMNARAARAVPPTTASTPPHNAQHGPDSMSDTAAAPTPNPIQLLLLLRRCRRRAAAGPVSCVDVWLAHAIGGSWVS